VVFVQSADKQGDPERIPFSAEINLAGLQPGRYLLEVTVEDRTTQKSASQQTAFYIYQAKLSTLLHKTLTPFF